MIAPITNPSVVITHGLQLTCQVDPKWEYTKEIPNPTAPPITPNSSKRLTALDDDCL